MTEQDLAICIDIEELAQRCYDNSKEKGFWDNEGDRNIPTKLCLVHSELSEALEGHREGNPPSEKVPDITKVEEELADAIIRILDLSKFYDLRIGKAVVLKMAYNSGRPYRHGNKVC